MALYRVLITGTEIDVPAVDGGAPIVGFHAERAVRAATRDLAAEWARSLVMSEWANEPGQRANRKGPPVLRVERVERIGLLRYFKHANRGFTFYTATADSVEQR